MGKIGVHWDPQFTNKINKLANKGMKLCKYSLYGGAQIIADEIAKNIESLPVEENHYVNTAGKIDHQHPPSFDQLRCITPEMKEALMDEFGVSTMQCGGDTVDVLIGVTGTGYSNIVTKEYPNGIPVNMIARSIESGSSVRQKHPFVRPAVRRSLARAKAEMQKRAEEYIKNFNL